MCVAHGFVAVLIALLPLSVSGGAYKWKDATGRTHFTDQPPPGISSEEVRIRTFSNSADASAESPERPGVTIYTAQWCGVCKKAKAWLNARGIAYVEHDVEKSEAGRSGFRQLGGAGVPVILVGKQRMDGFSPERLEKMLTARGN